MSSSLRDLTVTAWETTLGREGMWCAHCRCVTPTAQVDVRGADAYLRCERCRRLLHVGESWSGSALRRVPHQRGRQPQGADQLEV